jgi:ABC-type nitrate/sulfonate/bicarbonate transport system permease component
MIGGLRVGLAIVLTISVATDFMGSSSGLGRSIDTARVTFNVPAIFLLLIIAAVMGLTLDHVLSIGLRRTAHWLGRTAKG